MSVRRRGVVLAVLGLLVVSAGLWLSASVTVAPQWAVHEITLTAQEQHTHPYTEVAVSAEFTGPGGLRQTVPGFWDGGPVFKIRFTPIAPGLWTYRTQADVADPGLQNRSGFLWATEAAPGSHGFLRRDAAHPHHFVFDDGTRYFMWGQTYYEIIRNALAGDAWQRALDETQAKGLTKVRLLLYPWPAENPYPDAQPFVNGDHDRPDVAYWQKLDEVVGYLGARGLIADLILFTDSERVFGAPEQDERYVRYVLARYAAYPNVIWCLSNEWTLTDKDKAYWDELGRLVRENDPWLKRDGYFRPLSVHQGTQLTFAFAPDDWPVYASIQFGEWQSAYTQGDVWGHLSIAENRAAGMPVVNDEYGYLGHTQTPQTITDDQHRRAAWGIALAGGYGSAGDDTGYTDGRPIFSANWHDAAAYDDLTRLIQFFTARGWRYWEMTSYDEQVTGQRVYALGDEAQGYVVYAAAGGAFSLELPQGRYRVTRFDPRDGAETDLGTVEGGAQRFTLPIGLDWVMELRRLP